MTETRMGFVAVINDSHKGRDTGKKWARVVDVSAVLMIFVSLTGFTLVFFLFKTPLFRAAGARHRCRPVLLSLSNRRPLRASRRPRIDVGTGPFRNCAAFPQRHAAQRREHFRCGLGIHFETTAGVRSEEPSRLCAYPE